MRLVSGFDETNEVVWNLITATSHCQTLSRGTYWKACEFLLLVLPGLLVPPVPGDQLETKANIGKARRVLGYDPKVSLKEGLKQTVAWFVEKFGLR